MAAHEHHEHHGVEDGGAADDEFSSVLTGVGPRLRALRTERGTTLAQLSETTGISLSTLSRLESGGRKPTLELLLPLAKAYGVQLDELVGAPDTGDPRVTFRPFNRHGMTFVPLTRHIGGVNAYKQVMPGLTGPPGPVEQRVHEGYEWLYVLSGRLRLVLGEHDLVLKAGEVAEFDTRTPHWWGNVGPEPVEFLSLFGPQGERMHVRAKPSARQ
ncbi:XRE family transcriptional regulator [Streptomyces sp. 840.1]|uniref:helix-turn-helix domain-containing protein n=1 Tax=Streptomyces sp. 840.1 TaxID=2485152 RepID=UPI000F4945FA|nr:helix-turn-helix transcriptional regulator [Streptomyces sp. 840.1]ROQ67034.1 XRE family transcriptional regulator [Streptomyces sp. 840.1]